MPMSTPDNLQSIVCNLIKEYLKKKAFFSIEDIVVFIANRVRANPNLNRNSIEIIVKNLIKRRILIPGTKLMKNNIIEHPIRNEIYNYIRKNPSNINEIMKAINIHSNQALWHLSCLEKFRFTRSKKIENQRIIFEYESNSDLDDLYFYLKQDIVRDIITLLKDENIPFKIMEIATNLKRNYNTVKKYLEILKNLNLIIVEKDKKRNLFRLDLEKYEKIRKSINDGEI
jgi:predicted transcriptional regulator